MTNNIYAGSVLFITGLVLFFYCSISGFEKLENRYKKIEKNKITNMLESQKIIKSKDFISDLKTEITQMNNEVNSTGKQMNFYLLKYQKSKKRLDSLIDKTNQNFKMVDTLLEYYNKEIFQTTLTIDSINSVYESSSEILIAKVNLLEKKNTKLEQNILKKNYNKKTNNIKFAGFIFHIFIFLSGILLGIVFAAKGFNVIKRNIVTA